MINRKNFFDKVRQSLFGGEMSLTQVKNMLAILNEWEKRGLKDLRWLAYMLATTYHETARTMAPIKEFGMGKGRLYGRPDPVTKEVYAGRGYIQLTWLDNYKKMAQLTGEDLVNNPDLALRPDIATKIMFEGMIRGMFTGKALKDYFDGDSNDLIGARRIINGTDKAQLIAGYHSKFFSALS